MSWYRMSYICLCEQGYHRQYTLKSIDHTFENVWDRRYYTYTMSRVSGGRNKSQYYKNHEYRREARIYAKSYSQYRATRESHSKKIFCLYISSSSQESFMRPERGTKYYPYNRREALRIPTYRDKNHYRSPKCKWFRLYIYCESTWRRWRVR